MQRTLVETLRPKLSRSLAVVGGGTLFGLVGAHLFRQGLGESDLYLLLVGGFTAVFFGAAAISSLVKTCFDPPRIEVHTTGLLDRASMASAGFLPWSEILAIEAKSFSGQPFVVIEVTDPESIVARQHFLTAFLMRKNQKLASSPVCIPAAGFAGSAPELAERLARHRPAPGGARPGAAP